MRTWFTSDTHFYHRNIIKYCKRPYTTDEELATGVISNRSVERMNADLILRWNDRVAPDDTVYHLGDFAFGKPEQWQEVLTQLRGHKILIIGNHDDEIAVRKGKCKTPGERADFFVRMGFDHALSDAVLSLKRTVLLTHVPTQPLPGQAAYNLCGHVHNEWAKFGPHINVGVDVRNYQPVLLEELLSLRNPTL